MTGTNQSSSPQQSLQMSFAFGHASSSMTYRPHEAHGTSGCGRTRPSSSKTVAMPGDDTERECR